MQELIKKIHKKAKSELKTIVLPEGDEARVKQAAKEISAKGLAKVILLNEKDLKPEKLKIYGQEFYELRKHKGVSLADAQLQVSKPLYYGAMMVRNREADGFVAGASLSTPDVARCAIYCLGVNPDIATVSSCFIMVVPNCSLGAEGVFVFADCGIVPNPTAKELANIAIATAELTKEVLEFTPRIAMLSYSTKGSAKGEAVDKVREATQLVKNQRPDLIIDGELQVDSAIVPEVAKIKDPQGQFAGEANILIFPNLDSGNISYKLVNRLAKARAIGPLLQGLNFPCSDLSRGCNVEEIIDCVAVTAVRAQYRK
ncbi:MAG: phosphate acetyltransferase [Candidatus Omnitrophota bacterium]|nr:phosphate acetyltransferase [Candidatus Omnitrophota bacterium]